MDNKINNNEVWVVMSNSGIGCDTDAELFEVCTSLEKAQEKLCKHIKDANSMASSGVFENHLLDEENHIISDEDYDNFYREVTYTSLYINDDFGNFMYFWIEKRELC